MGVVEMVDKDVPNPGSDEATEMGCTCPVLDNAHGVGFAINREGVAVFWINETCPIHGRKSKL